MEKIYRKDISTKKVYKRIGNTYYQVYCDKAKHICVYDIINKDGQHRGYEVMKGVKYTNPDGSVVYTMPSDEQFGKYAWTTIGTENTYDKETEQVLDKVFQTPSV